ncbi:MAG: FixH family protein, partial [Chloroflexota bacterium]|nr:FixH family protein [Chloroflexota bacterium]
PPTLAAVLSPTTSAGEPTLPPQPVSTTLTLSQSVQGVEVALTTVHAATDDLIVSLRGVHGPLSACAATPTAGADCTLSVKVTITEIDDNTSDTEMAAPLPGGGYAVPSGPYLALDGNWQIVVAVRRYNQPEDVEVAFRYVVNGLALTGKIGDYVHVRVQTDPSPPRSGPVQLRFHLTDEQGRPVSDATVQMQGIMAAHGHVSALVALHSVGGGDYTATLLMDMSGGWGLDLTIQRPGHDPTVATVALDLDKSDYDLTPYPSPNITPGGR